MKHLIKIGFSILLFAFFFSPAHGQDAETIANSIANLNKANRLTKSFTISKERVLMVYGAEVARDLTTVVRRKNGFVAYMKGAKYVCEVFSDGHPDSFYFADIFGNRCFSLEELNLK